MERALRVFIGKCERKANMNRILRCLCLVCVVVQSGCQRDSSNSSGKSISTVSSNKTVRIKVLIDGADTIKIHGHEIWYEHESWDLPGRWQGRDEPTFVNGKPWHPHWKGDQRAPLQTPFEDFLVLLGIPRRPPDCKSAPFEGLNPEFKPQSPAETKLTKFTARGAVTISQMPSPENDETLAIHFDDSQIMGADWYEVEISWK
jgi:hypothetical protein